MQNLTSFDSKATDKGLSVAEYLNFCFVHCNICGFYIWPDSFESGFDYDHLF